MDNIVWVIIAAAVTIALGGILLYAGSGTLGDVTESATEILNLEPEETQVGEDESTGQNQGPGGSTGSGDNSGGTNCPEDPNNPFRPPGC